jgi:hypothetical protein
MKKLLLVCFTIAVCTIGRVNAQCAMCTPVDCAAQKPTGGLCNYLPDDTAGQPYDEVISFYMPKRLTDPTTLAQCSGCSYVELRRIRIGGITGLPTGMSASPNHPNGLYDVQNGDSTGCVRFCGTPVAPGVYYIVVNLLADVTAVGTPIGNVDANNQAQTYRDTIEIFPSTSECPQSFSLGSGACQLKACDSVAVNLNATLTNQYCPNLISYAWDFGNGGTSVVKTPGVVNYTVPDTFSLSLTTTYYTYRITQFTVELTGGYSGDIEETTTLFNPDPYITIPSIGYNGRGTGGDDRDEVTITGVNLVIPDNACASPLTIIAWDEDQGPPFGSQDDNCGTHTIFPSVPNQVSSTVSNSKIWVSFDTVAVSSLTESVDVIVFPHPPIPELLMSEDSICNGDTALIYLSAPLPGYAFNWFLNDTIELQSTDSVIQAAVRGDYKVKITNTVTGCSEWSSPVTLSVGQAAPASVNLLFNGTSAFVSPFPSSGFAVDWYYNGNLVVGQNGKFLTFLGNGEYRAEVYNIAYPFCRTSTSADTITVSGISDMETNAVYDVNVFPNPNNGKFRVSFNTDETQNVRLVLTSAIGQVVSDRTINNFSGQFNEELNVTDLSKGVYVLTIETPRGRTNNRIIVQ